MDIYQLPQEHHQKIFGNVTFVHLLLGMLSGLFQTILKRVYAQTTMLSFKLASFWFILV